MIRCNCGLLYKGAKENPNDIDIITIFNMKRCVCGLLYKEGRTKAFDSGEKDILTI